ncbi:MAG: VanZ family protein [Acidobacteriota bacterium]
MSLSAEERVRRRSLLLPLLWMAIIFYVSGKPSDPDAPSWLPLPVHGDKVLHLIVHGFLGLLLQQAFVIGLGHPIRRLWPAVLIGWLHGAFDEWHQSWVPGRIPDLFDWIADAVGVVLGAWSLGLLMAWRWVNRPEGPPSSEEMAAGADHAWPPCQR